jgi:hypothetical protein
MKIFTFTPFLTRGAAEISAGFRACAIHPSSEVDLVTVGQHRLGVGAIVPLSKTQPTPITAVRAAPDGFTPNQQDAWTVGQHLVLQLYEDCDELVPPGPRMAVSRSAIITAAALPALVANAVIAFRLPMQGRAMACIRMQRSTTAADLSLLIQGWSWGEERAASNQGPRVVESSENWFNGGGAGAVAGLRGDVLARQVYVGGDGDGETPFDELVVYAYGAAGGISYIEGVAFGELTL